jgi:NAD(P)-dependent dehydrogenase (short-subunit alcohol dehydrogenase family)
VAPIELMNLAHFEIELRTRLVGAVGLTQACLPLIRQGHGRIVWISTPAIIPTPYVASIHACDFAVNCVARTLNLELKPWNIPNILIRCGGIKTENGLRTTEGVEALLKDASNDRAPLYRQVLQKWGADMAAFDEKRTDPDEVAQVILKALRAPRPKNRYAIGYMAGMAALLESLPQPVADGILKMRF